MSLFARRKHIGRRARGHLISLALLACLGCRGAPDAAPDKVLVFKYGKVSAPPGFMEGLLEKFEAENPGCDVIAEQLPASSDQQHQYYAINLEGGYEGIDVMTLDVIWVPEFARASWIEDLTGRWAETDRADYLTGPVQAARWDGRYWAVPWYVDAGVLYHRKDLLEKHGQAVPTTLDELASVTRVILEKEASPDLDGYLWQGRQYEGLVCAMLEMLRGQGGEVLGSDGSLQVSGERTKQALARVRALFEEGISPPDVTTLDEEGSRIRFQSGQAIFLRNWPYAWTLFQAEGSPVKDRVGLGAVPGGKPTLGGWQLAINRFGRKKELAWKLVEFLSRPATQKGFALEAGLKPPRRSLYTHPEIVEKQPFMSRMLPILENARPRPVTPFYLMMSQELQLEFSAVVAGIRDPEDALDRLARRLERVMTLDRKEGP